MIEIIELCRTVSSASDAHAKVVHSSPFCRISCELDPSNDWTPTRVHSKSSQPSAVFQLRVRVSPFVARLSQP